MPNMSKAKNASLHTQGAFCNLLHSPALLLDINRPALSQLHKVDLKNITCQLICKAAPQPTVLPVQHGLLLHFEDFAQDIRHS